MAERRLDLRFADLSDAKADVRALREQGYELTGNWSLAQILDHLNKALAMTFDGADFGPPAVVRPIIRMIMMPMVRRGAPIKMRAKAPGPVKPKSVDQLDEDECAQRFYELADRLLAADAQFVHPHPMMGKLNRQQWLDMQTWHCAHHLSFAVPKGA